MKKVLNTSSLSKLHNLKKFQNTALNSNFENVHYKKDALFNSLWLQKFMNTTLTSDGNKSRSEKIVYNSFHELKRIYCGSDALPILFESTEKVKSAVETRPVRLGGNIIQVPVYIIGARRIKTNFLRFRQAFFNRNEKNVQARVIKEVSAILTFPKESYLVQLENKFWEVVYSNRSYIHFRWY